ERDRLGVEGRRAVEAPVFALSDVGDPRVDERPRCRSIRQSGGCAVLGTTQQGPTLAQRSEGRRTEAALEHPRIEKGVARVGDETGQEQGVQLELCARRPCAGDILVRAATRREAVVDEINEALVEV